ncbi:MAG TPA: nucleoside recognition protein [Firmicutes bacterium]|jgi:spore maturation protein SpmB|nr:nucleoside recognition protein [Bacillota bacterium]
MNVKGVIERGMRNSWGVILELAVVMVPAIILVGVLEAAGIMPRLAVLLEPVMSWFGLPGEAAIALVVGFLVGPYGSVGLAVGLRLSPAEMTILGTMVLIAHSLITETAIAARAGANGLIVLGARLAAALLAGVLLGQLL